MCFAYIFSEFILCKYKTSERDTMPYFKQSIYPRGILIKLILWASFLKLKCVTNQIIYSKILQNIICRTSSIETGIRNAVKEALKEIQSAETLCNCGRETALGCCRKCLMREVSRRLQSHGYNSAVCKTKWRTSVDIPAGIIIRFFN